MKEVITIFRSWWTWLECLSWLDPRPCKYAICQNRTYVWRCLHTVEDRRCCGSCLRWRECRSCSEPCSTNHSSVLWQHVSNHSAVSAPAAHGAAHAQPLVPLPGRALQLGAELEVVLVPPRVVGGILPILSSSAIVSVNNAVQEACCCNYLVSSFMYGMKQKNINKKAKITTITISATIPSKT